MIIDDIPTRLITDTAFERWNLKAKNEFIEKFQKAYNFVKNTDYQVTASSLIDEQDFDFTLTNRAGDLMKIQHTFAGADAGAEYIDSKMQRLLEAELRKQRNGLENIFLSIGFKKFLLEKREAVELAADIKRMVTGIIEKRGGVQPTETLVPIFHYQHTDENSPEATEKVKEYLSHLDLFSNNSKEMILGYGGKARAVLSDDIRATMAIGHKEDHYSNPEDITLIVHHNFPFFADFFVPTIKSAHASSSFKGIWIYAAWEDDFILIK